MSTIFDMGYSIIKGSCVHLNKRGKVIKGDNISKFACHLNVGNTVANLKIYVYCTKMKENVARFLRGSMLYCTQNTKIRKKGLI
jgi:hypothetical protein